MNYGQKSLLIIYFFVFFTLPNFAQTPNIQIMGIDLKTIENLVNDKESVYYYPDLVEKYNQLDSSLYRIDYIMLYYGYALQNEYRPFEDMKMEDSLHKLNLAGKFAEVEKLSTTFLQHKPTSFFGNIEKGASLYSLEDSLKSVHFLEKYNRLFMAVESAGVGNSYDDPIVLVSPMDAEVFLRRYQLQVLKREIEEKEERKYLYFEVRSPDKTAFPIYFDVTIPFAFMENKK